MNNTSEIQNRMKSIRQTVQIANAQKLIAASRIGRARKMLKQAAPYHDRIRQSIAGVLQLCPDVSSNYMRDEGKVYKKRGLLVITSDRGLAGGYNSNLFKLTEKSLAQNPAERLIVLGNVGITHFSLAGKVLEEGTELPVDPPTLMAARDIAEHVAKMFNDGDVDSFDIIYTHFVSTVRTAPKEARLLPLKAEDFGAPDYPTSDVSFEPGPGDILSVAIPKYLKGFIYGCLIHSWASELASRVMAMDNAIRNGTEILDALSLAFNRARQAMITQEITEIVAGAAAMADE